MSEDEGVLQPHSLRVLRVEDESGTVIPFLAVEVQPEQSLDANLVHFGEEAHSFLAGRYFYCFKLDKAELERLAYYALVVVGQMQPD